MRKLNLLVFVMLLSYIIIACSPSQANQNAQATLVMADFFATQTAAPTATATLTPAPTSTPTPIPGKFLDPPESLETVYFPKWIWLYNAANQRVGWTFGREGKYLPSMFYEGNYEIGFSLIINEPLEDEEQLFTEHISEGLQYFVSATALEQILLFVKENKDYGTYKETIESFEVTLQITVNSDNKRTLVLFIIQN